MYNNSSSWFLVLDADLGLIIFDMILASWSDAFDDDVHLFSLMSFLSVNLRPHYNYLLTGVTWTDGICILRNGFGICFCLSSSSGLIEGKRRLLAQIVALLKLVTRAYVPGLGREDSELPPAALAFREVVLPPIAFLTLFLSHETPEIADRAL